jgi:hypothetical protein
VASCGNKDDLNAKIHTVHCARNLKALLPRGIGICERQTSTARARVCVRQLLVSQQEKSPTTCSYRRSFRRTATSHSGGGAAAAAAPRANSNSKRLEKKRKMADAGGGANNGILLKHVVPALGCLVATALFVSPLQAVLAVRRAKALGALNPLPMVVVVL